MRGLGEKNIQFSQRTVHPGPLSLSYGKRTNISDHPSPEQQNSIPSSRPQCSHLLFLNNPNNNSSNYPRPANPLPPLPRTMEFSGPQLLLTLSDQPPFSNVLHNNLQHHNNPLSA